MSSGSVFVIGDPDRLPEPIRQKLAVRQVDSLNRAQVCVVVLCTHQDQWPEGVWTLLRRAHQDHHQRVVALGIDDRGASFKPPKPWPGSAWIRIKGRRGPCWYELANDRNGYDPGSTRILFPASRHRGQRLDECPLSYCDWLVGEPWLQPDSFLGRMLRLYLGRQAPGNLAHLDQEPWDSKGFVPGERLSRRCKDRRPREQIHADEERLDQDLRIVSPNEGKEKREVDRVVRWRSRDKLEARRIRFWLNALEAIDRIPRSEDLWALDQSHGNAQRLVEVLATVEGSEAVAQVLHQEAEELARERCRQLTRDVPDWIAIRGHEVVRRMRSARSSEDLLSVGLWIRHHRDLFDSTALQMLRTAYAFHRKRIQAVVEPV